MVTEKRPCLTVIENGDLCASKEHIPDINKKASNGYHTNVMYEKLLNFRNLQEQQKKRFTVDDLFKLC